MKLNPNVDVSGVSPEICLAMTVVSWVYWSYCERITVTSCKDGNHSRSSLHYTGDAIDLRIKDMTKPMAKAISDEIRESLGLQYDVVLEKTHIHIEFQPKR